ncbi:FAD-linked oxidase C-terminal domain-containing protein [Wenyingzhuangia sp. chi5]|uniref:FAD-linked oxidase C-terminal domain-containing protein n=1 Tax=Wenyingzhuangia gilva TaxID=3057677 RepID=A0ABT8VVB7_9FLAO|nr:FAD-binding and (Fe-S)-binding domain-containing protein [Wenyingzhuangia sp. chi5]MDO3695896.1 FAD-linked oxidase C-terminal domain-containing protein [Wenyingzhuangia sp. chi5]
MNKSLKKLEKQLEGSLLTDKLHKNIYATDASVYRKIPMGVAYPKSKSDIKRLIDYANQHQISLIPRTAGTSLAGQCVGDGLVVDVSKHFTQILNYNKELKRITVQPGVIRDDLNRFVQADGLFFGPNTSTANRCMIGGMVGNNSSGTTSIRYGVTRDKIIRLQTILSDGNEVVFEAISADVFKQKATLDSVEGYIYKMILNQFSKHEVQQEIIKEFPNADIHRRNTGYAIDELLKFEMFGGTEKTINLAKVLCGSEGTLAFTTEITLQLDDIPPTQNVMVASHFDSVQECMESVVIAMKHKLYNCELMDKIILDCTKSIRSQQENRTFLQGDPAAVLMLEVAADTIEEAQQQANALIADFENHGFGYAHPKIVGENIHGIHDLRKAGLGALGNLIGDKKAVACIEDTAVSLSDLPNFIADFSKMMKEFNQQAVYYAHAGAGEIHLRPILNLKQTHDVMLFRTITTRVAQLVKQYKGSLSGEHGDGIVRAEFIPMMIGEKNYALIKQLKETFDPNYIFNKGKIINPFPMDKALRYEVDRMEPEINTLMDFTENQGILRLAEQCNGSGDCRKSVEAGGTMCPSYRATKNEKDTTRARANALREVLTNNNAKNKFDDKTLKKVFDLCISCKACASECPSNVDVATLKAEFLYQYQEANGYSFRNKLFAKINNINEQFSVFSGLINMFSNTILAKKILGISTKRTLPSLKRFTLIQWIEHHQEKLQLQNPIKKVYFFNDEFTNFYDVQIGVDTIELLHQLNYQVVFLEHEQSGRALISKGFLKEAKEVANVNVTVFSQVINQENALVGVEPSAILTFRDEYLRLCNHKEKAQTIAKNTFTIEEFISKEIELGNISPTVFTQVEKEVKIHVHCHQKSLSNSKHTFEMLNIVPNYKVTILNTGCCGMAGSFGYEQEHYEVSMQMGEDTLFPKVRNISEETLIVASGTSCRHQIKDGTQRNSLHAVTVLRQALV